MSCPYCKMTLGWGPVAEQSDATKWYRLAKAKYTCAHCGKEVQRQQNTTLYLFGSTCFLVAIAILPNYENIEYIDAILAGLVITGLSSYISSILTVKYVKK